MGMDTVELVMDIKDEFRIGIPDEVASTLESVGDLHECVLSKLRERGEQPNEAQIWNRLCHLLVVNFGISPEKITRSAKVVRDLGLD